MAPKVKSASVKNSTECKKGKASVSAKPGDRRNVGHTNKDKNTNQIDREIRSHGLNGQNDNHGDDTHSDAASSLSSTPILVLKRMKRRKQRGSPARNRLQSGRRAITKSTVVKKPSSASSRNDRKDEKRTKKTETPKASNSTRKNNAKESSGVQKESNDDSTGSSSEQEEAACCLCFCGVDCSDRALFFPKDRKEELEDDEDYYFGLEDPYLEEELYDRNNALVYCDSCNRLYHQKCHFVPLLVIPRGDWNCLICSIQQQQQQQAKPTKTISPSHKKRKRSSGKTSSSKDDVESLPIHDNKEWRKFLNRKVTDHLFQTPTRADEIQATPGNAVGDVKSLQKEWEIASAVYKAQLWHRQMKQFKTFLTSQASNIRRTNSALATMTSTKRNRQYFSGNGARSQELAQTIVQQTGAKFKIRNAFISLETLRIRDEPVDFACLVSWCKQHPQHAAHVFPFGAEKWKNDRRIVPRTEERKIENAKGNHFDLDTSIKGKSGHGVPSEINVNGKKASMATNPSKSAGEKERKTKSSTSVTKAKNGHQRGDEDDDSGISLDNLQCSVCMIGDSTDENDVILCDGQNCHRAFHMKCVYPAVSMDDVENEEEDWFCPICTGVSTLMGEMHDLCIGSEDPDIEDESMASWDDIMDIFPDSEWEYHTALKLLKGKRNADTQRLLAMYLGENINDQPVQMPVGSDSEDENDYSLFDEQSFAERKKKKREAVEKSDSDDSTTSSQATLVAMSSVEDVDRDELAALAADGEMLHDDESSAAGSEDGSDEGRMRKSRRLRKKMLHADGDDSRSVENGADFSEANIIEGKRRRTKVDYRKLNEALFGCLDEKQNRQLDDKDEFKVDRRKAGKKSSSEESDSDSSGSDEDTSVNSSDEGN
ncbi:PHD-finger domain containing protein [Nitzschia inconspicua]|uniref:PHD-finger domain containing protein n=1 Tax=Nitzschia inconspicua TaxID=303405 RepID=A0A9K3PR94_9STRA|nr:PHD-finger domain containing protein [Nitzschia inconspicua]